MHSSLPLLAILGAGALALPSLKHRHLHQKRDQYVTITRGNEVIVEVTDDVTVTVGAGQTASTSAPSAPENLAVAPVQQKNAYPGGNGQWQHSFSFTSTPPSITPVQPSVTPIATPSTSAKQVPVSVTPVASSTPQASATPASSAASAPAPSGKAWESSPESPAAGGSGALDVLGSANNWRQKWQGLPGFTWDSTLAENAYKTTSSPITTGSDGKSHNEGGAKEMNHMLYPGSMAQCIAGGSNDKNSDNRTPFENAFLMWICESPTAAIQDVCTVVNSHVSTKGDTGHADIIKSTDYTKIGCYYMDTVGETGTGMWTCDFA